ncbi:unnamed protein product [Arctogadus glacialis]
MSWAVMANWVSGGLNPPMTSQLLCSWLPPSANVEDRQTLTPEVTEGSTSEPASPVHSINSQPPSQHPPALRASNRHTTYRICWVVLEQQDLVAAGKSILGQDVTV